MPYFNFPNHDEIILVALVDVICIFVTLQENILDILVENHGRVNYVNQGFNKYNEERKGMYTVSQ